MLLVDDNAWQIGGDANVQVIAMTGLLSLD